MYETIDYSDAEIVADSLSISAESWLVRAAEMTVRSDDDYRNAASALHAIKDLQREADRVFGDAIKRAHEAHRAMVAAKRGITDPLDQAEKAIKRTMGAYQQEQERIVAAERRRLEEERETLRRKLEAEAKAKADQEALDRAYAALARGDKAAAAAELEAETPAIQVVLPAIEMPQAVSVPTASTRHRTVAKVVDASAFLHWTADLPRWDEFVTIKEGALCSLVGTPIPGVEFVDEITVISR